MTDDEILALARRVWTDVDVDVDGGVVYGPPNPERSGIRLPYLVAPDGTDETLGLILTAFLDAVPEPEPEVALEWEEEERRYRLLPTGVREVYGGGRWYAADPERSPQAGLANAVSELRGERSALKLLANAAEGTMHKAIDRAQAAEAHERTALKEKVLFRDRAEAAEAHIEALNKALQRARRYVEKAESERDGALARLAAAPGGA